MSTHKSLSPTLLSLLILLCAACGNKDIQEETIPSTPPVDVALQHRIDSFVTHVPHIGDLGLLVYDLTANEEVYSLNPDTLMQPASCMKLFTSVAALSMLGSHACHRTEIYTTGHIKADTLQGNIILKIHFDPYFTADSLTRLLACLPPQIKHLSGKVIVDMNNPSPMPHEEHWVPGDLKSRYLSLSFTGYRKIARLLPYLIKQTNGINVTPQDITPGTFNPRKAHLCGTVRTPIAYSIYKALKFSSNINAECMLYPMGYQLNPHGNYRSGGLHALRQFISNQILPSANNVPDAPGNTPSIHDGCGLCPENRVSPDHLVTLLRYAWHRPHIRQTLLASLPRSGTDGTLHDRLRKPHLKGRVTAKTGTLTRDGGISTLAGYFTANDGHTIAFAIMNNRCPVPDGRWWQDRLIEKAFLTP